MKLTASDAEKDAEISEQLWRDVSIDLSMGGENSRTGPVVVRRIDADRFSKILSSHEESPARRVMNILLKGNLGIYCTHIATIYL